MACFSRRLFTKEWIPQFAAKTLAAPATLVSDGLGCFTAVHGTGILHEPHVTGGGAACVKRREFLAVNTVLANLKTAFGGTYHALGFEKYGHRYLAQVQYLFNRRFDLRTILRARPQLLAPLPHAHVKQYGRLNLLADQEGQSVPPAAS